MTLVIRYGRTVLAGLLLALGSTHAGAQTAPPAAAPDYSKVVVKTTKLAPNFYALEGQGGTIGALVGPDGALLVDSQFGPLTEKLVAALKQVSDGRVRFLINTHVHNDHTNGNANFAALGATVLARDELRERLAASTLPGGGAPPAPALPLVTYRGPVTFHINGEDVEAVPLAKAHTDGDTVVRFPKSNVLMTGDIFRSIGYPNIDRANGGSLPGIVAAMNSSIEMAGPETKVVPGHGPITDRAGLVAHRDMIVGVRDRVAKLVQEGKTGAEVVAAKPTADFDARIANAAQSSERFVGQVYDELKGTR